MDERAGSREATTVERRAAEAARVEVAKLEFRVTTLEALEGECRNARAQYEKQRGDCARAEQAAAVLEAEKLAPNNQVQELKGELASARTMGDRLDKKLQELSELFDKERTARAAIERELAVALGGGQPTPAKEIRKQKRQQATLWQGDPSEDQALPPA